MALGAGGGLGDGSGPEEVRRPRPLRGRLTAAGRQQAARRVMAIAARYPRLWRFARSGVRRRFDGAAPRWSGISGTITSQHFAPVRAALERLPAGFAPRRIADIGTGTGLLAVGLAERYPDAEVRGFDLAPAMVAEARRHPAAQAGPDGAPRLRFTEADSSALPVPGDAFDLVVLSNTLLFFSEIARVSAPGALAVVAFSRGPRTPLYLPLREVARGLERVGLECVGSGEAGEGEWLLARRPTTPGVPERGPGEGSRRGFARE